MNRWFQIFSSLAIGVFTNRDLVELAVALLLTTAACVVFRLYPVLSAKVAGGFQRSANRPFLYVLASMLLPLVLRLALLPWFPPPEPHIHDEFGHLLVADTLLAGRLANPPHPLWRHLETIYILQHPTYSSSYPLGQGTILAVGKAFTGSAWAGVMLAVVLMCGALSWMLFGCLPPKWAAAGSLLAALHYGLAEQWVDTYWGGALCAFGGALLFGALCRLRKWPSLTMALLVGLGWAIVWFTRPFESLLLLLILWSFIAAFARREPGRWRIWLGPILSIMAVQISVGGVAALHNRAVTGSFTTLPYQLSQKVYGVPQSLLWQKPIAEPPLHVAEFKEMYWWQRRAKDLGVARPGRQLTRNLLIAWRLFLGPWYSLPMVLVVFLCKDRRVALGGGIITVVLLVSIVYPFFFPHYIAAYSCVIFFLTLRGMMTLRHWSFRGIAAGPLVLLFLTMGGAITDLRVFPFDEILLHGHGRQAGLRVQVSDKLLRFGGRHVVFVRYGANHNFKDEWIYNSADVDASPIVWCRAIDATGDTEVTQYYKDRKFWVADVDRDTVRVSRYPGAPASGEETENWILASRAQ